MRPEPWPASPISVRRRSMPIAWASWRQTTSASMERPNGEPGSTLRWHSNGFAVGTFANSAQPVLVRRRARRSSRSVPRTAAPGSPQAAPALARCGHKPSAAFAAPPAKQLRSAGRHRAWHRRCGPGSAPAPRPRRDNHGAAACRPSAHQTSGLLTAKAMSGRASWLAAPISPAAFPARQCAPGPLGAVQPAATATRSQHPSPRCRACRDRPQVPRQRLISHPGPRQPPSDQPPHRVNFTPGEQLPILTSLTVVL